jgi:hypothetical protein
VKRQHSILSERKSENERQKEFKAKKITSSAILKEIFSLFPLHTASSTHIPLLFERSTQQQQCTRNNTHTATILAFKPPIHSLSLSLIYSFGYFFFFQISVRFEILCLTFRGSVAQNY